MAEDVHKMMEKVRTYFLSFSGDPILISRCMLKLRKENNQLRLENSQLFKELDVINRKVKSKFSTSSTPRSLSSGHAL